MKTYKNEIVFIILTMIIIVSIMKIVSSGYSSHLYGKEVDVNSSEYLNNGELYCIEAGQEMNSQDFRMTVTGKVNYSAKENLMHGYTSNTGDDGQYLGSVSGYYFKVGQNDWNNVVDYAYIMAKTSVTDLERHLVTDDKGKTYYLTRNVRQWAIWKYPHIVNNMIVAAGGVSANTNSREGFTITTSMKEGIDQHRIDTLLYEQLSYMNGIRPESDSYGYLPSYGEDVISVSDDVEQISWQAEAGTTLLGPIVVKGLPEGADSIKWSTPSNAGEEARIVKKEADSYQEIDYSALKEGGDFYIAISTASLDAIIAANETIEINFDFGKRTIYGFKSVVLQHEDANSSFQNFLRVWVTEDPLDFKTSIEITPIPYEKIKIEIFKTGTPKNGVEAPIANVEFELSTTQSEDGIISKGPLYTSTSTVDGETGRLIFDETNCTESLVYGQTYYYREVSLPDWAKDMYVLDPNWYPITVGENGKYTDDTKTIFKESVTVINGDTEKYKLYIYKYDSGTNIGLNGIQFTIYDKDTGDVWTVGTTSNGGHLEFDREVYVGKTYTVEETSLGTEHDGKYYKIASYDVTIIPDMLNSDSGEIRVEFDIPNDPVTDEARLKVIKKGSDGLFLSGAEFLLTGSDGTTQPGTTVNGYLTFTGLKDGVTYELTETKAPDGYTGISGVVDTITPNDSDGIIEYESNVVNDKKTGQSLKIVKRDYYIPDMEVTGITFTLQVVKIDETFTTSEKYYAQAADGIWDPVALELTANQVKGLYVDSTGNLVYKCNYTNKEVLTGYTKEGVARYEYVDCWNSTPVSATEVELKVDSNGELEIPLKYSGTYTLKEVSRDTATEDLGYTEKTTSGALIMYKDGTDVGVTELNIIVKGDEHLEYTVLNKRDIKFNIKGRIWIDGIDGKTGSNDSLMVESSNKVDITSDNILANVEVRLMKEGSSTPLDTQYTDKDGAYEFEEIEFEIMDAGGLTVEFEYNGVMYTSVGVGTATNASKAVEVVAQRTDLNSDFTTIEGTSAYQGKTNAGIDLYYVDKASTTNIDWDTTLREEYHYLGWNNNTSTHYKYAKNNFAIDAITDSKYLYDEYKAAMSDIKNRLDDTIVTIDNVNLGVKEREQADVSIMTDLEKVKITFNGYSHTYTYGTRTAENAKASDYGVAFQSPYTGNYSTAVYYADVVAKAEGYVDTDFRMDVIYRIEVRNETSELVQIIDEISNVYDKNYTYVGAGESIDEAGNIKDEITSGISNSGNELTIRTPEIFGELGTSKSSYIYVNFCLEGVDNDDWLGEELTNTVEITKYTTKQNGSSYAAIDEDSNPGNMSSLHQDDSDKAPNFKIEQANERTMEGIVFKDAVEISGAENIRQGNGYYDKDNDEDEPLKNIQVELIRLEGNVEKEYYYTNGSIGNTTNAGSLNSNDGTFKFKGFMAGDYIVRYTWGTEDEELNVRDYKATIYNDQSRQTNPLWFTDEGTHNSDAMDIDSIRYEIDNDIKTQTYDEHRMESETPLMNIGVEYEDNKGTTNESTNTSTTNSDDVNSGNVGMKVDPYEIKKVDFGIVERAKQSLTIEKSVHKFEIYLQNGVKIVDWEEGTQGISGLQYIQNSMIKQEMDNEILEGATAVITYEIILTNTGELDYLDLEAERLTYSTMVSGFETETSNDKFDENSNDKFDENSNYANLNTYYTADNSAQINLEQYYDYYKYGSSQSTIDTDSNVIKLSAKVIDVTDGGLGLVDKTTDEYDWELISFGDYNTEYMKGELTITEYEAYVGRKSTYILSKEVINAIEKTDGRQENMQATDKAIMYNLGLYEPIGPKDEPIVSYLETSKILSNVDEHKFENTVEIVRVHQRGGTRARTTGSAFVSDFDDTAEIVTITPPTGGNRNYTEYVIIGIAAISIIATAAVVIKRKVIE